VAFDASASFDQDSGDSISSYRFDFGDGSAAQSQSTPTTSHVYATAGSYTATVAATDNHGAVSANPGASQITVGSPPPGNHAPTAAMSATPNAGSAPLDVAFDGSASSDPDSGDHVATYRFDFGDG